MLFSQVKIPTFRAKAHLLFHWCLYNKGTLSSGVFERRSSTGSVLFVPFGRDLQQIVGQIAYKRRVKTLSSRNLVASRHVKREKSSHPVERASLRNVAA